MSDLVERLRNHVKWVEPDFDLVESNLLLTAADRIEALEAEADKWHSVAMKAGAITCVGGGHIYPLRDRIEALEAALRETIDAMEYRTVTQALQIAHAALAPSTDTEPEVKPEPKR